MNAAPLSLAALLLLPGPAGAAPLWVGHFSGPEGDPPTPWRLQRFDEKIPATRYRVRQWDGVWAIEAHAVRSMALLLRPLTVDLGKTPVLCWRWRIEAPVAAGDLTRKSGDDYAARVYLSFDIAPEHLGLGTRTKLALGRSLFGSQVPDGAVNYVWDNRQPVGTVRDNAYTDRAKMQVLQSGGAQAGRWVSERRDVVADFQRAFGHPPRRITGLAIATDTDNTGEEARGGFADFHFVAADEACVDG